MPSISFEGPTKKIMVEKAAGQLIQELQFKHYTGKLILTMSEGHIIGYTQEDEDGKE